MQKRLFTPLRLGAGLWFSAAAALILPLVGMGGQTGHTLVSSGLSFAPRGDDWLAIDDPRDPATWLAERGGGAVEAAFLREKLAGYDRRFEESGRMIANRLIQISSIVGDVDPARLLADFAAEAGAPRSFGALAQHYLVLRRQGLSHGAAITALHSVYGGGE